MSKTNVPESSAEIQPAGAEEGQLQPVGVKKPEFQLEEIDKATVVSSFKEHQGAENTAGPSEKDMPVTKVPSTPKDISKMAAKKSTGPNKSIRKYENLTLPKPVPRNLLKDFEEIVEDEVSGAGKNTPQPPLAKKEGQPEMNESDEVPAIKKCVEDQRKETSEQPSSSSVDANQAFKPTPVDMTKILKTMVCLSCNKVPSPFRLFHCPRGHLYCYGCGIKRFTAEEASSGATVSSDICGHQMEVQDSAGSSSSSSSTTTRGVGYGLIRPDFKLEETEVEELVIKNAGKMVCGLHLRESTGNPLFKAVFNNTKWSCPYKRFGCKEVLYGKDMHAHLELCVKKLGIF